MSKQLSVSSAFSVFALAALALLAPGSARLSEVLTQTGAATDVATPAVKLPFAG